MKVSFLGDLDQKRFAGERNLGVEISTMIGAAADSFVSNSLASETEESSLYCSSFKLSSATSCPGFAPSSFDEYAPRLTIEVVKG